MTLPSERFKMLKAGKRFAAEFGKTRVVTDLLPNDFAEYRVKLATTRRAVALGNEILAVRSILKFAYDEGHIAAPIRFGTAFQKTTAKKRGLNVLATETAIYQRTRSVFFWMLQTFTSRR